LSGQNEKLHDLLALLRADFIDSLTQQCFELEQLILSLSTGNSLNGSFDQLFRLVHSLKGAGGTHGLPLISSICHLFEDNLILSSKQKNFGKSFVTNSLALVDLMRLVAADDSSYAGQIAETLETCRLAVHRHYCSVMVLDSSKVIPMLLENLFLTMPVQVSMMVDGLQALNRLLYESFDVLIVSNSLRSLNGLALISALRANGTTNASTPVLFYTSRQKVSIAHLPAVKVFYKTPDLAQQLASETDRLSKSKA
jgi:HPt (histidine-containing phosphotransfer) domain-containing protein